MEINQDQYLGIKPGQQEEQVCVNSTNESSNSPNKEPVDPNAPVFSIGREKKEKESDHQSKLFKIVETSNEEGFLGKDPD